MRFTKGRPNTTKTKQSLFDNWIKPHLLSDGKNLDQCVTLWESHLQPGSIKSILYVALVFAINTGMRRGEVFGLQWGDIDIMKSTITVQRSYSGPTKSGRSRVIPINFALEKVILARMPLNSYNCLQGSRSQNIIPKTFDPGPRLKRACRKAGVREITFHSLRHTFATLALEAGRSPKLVSVQLGHCSVSTTINLYWNVTGETLDLGFLD